MPTTRIKFDLEYETLEGDPILIRIDARYSYDPGVWRDSNGEGYPPSFDLDYNILGVKNSDGETIDDFDESLIDTEKLDDWIIEYIESVEN